MISPVVDVDSFLEAQLVPVDMDETLGGWSRVLVLERIQENDDGMCLLLCR